MTKLLFVCGFPSGGTDLTKTILNTHPDIYINGEMPFLKNIAGLGYHRSREFTNIKEITTFQSALKKLDPWGNFGNIDHDFTAEIEAKGQLTLEEVLKACFSKNSCRVWGNKTPQNTENIDLLLNIFPNAFFLIVTRDVRDICLSWRNKWGKDMIWCAAKWAERMEKGWNITHNVPQDRYLYVKYENILSDTEICCRKICEFLGIEFSERMLEHHKYTTKKVDGKLNYGKKIKKDNKSKWKAQLPYATVKRIEEIAFSTMNVFDYRVEFASREKKITFRETLSGIWNDSWALLLTGNHASRQNTMRQRFRDVSFEYKKQLLKGIKKAPIAPQ